MVQMLWQEVNAIVGSVTVADMDKVFNSIPAGTLQGPSPPRSSSHSSAAPPPDEATELQQLSSPLKLARLVPPLTTSTAAITTVATKGSIDIGSLAIL
ncbi:hypothetical protein G7Z17_g10844 [Cylindrodendrum hubeiense]|uniref:Uncharacterized protein n=1 Tax=Cylindrodendrum hubeiense TaxID=595255 RepID=A0A9P5LAU7_9HYPO|nr:hypothetical protein G7Z17_g10844 [Cylindrodendrum hubeiense]